MTSMRGISFAHPDFDEPSRLGGFEVSHTGGLATTGGDALVRQSIMLLVTTRRGERVMRPEYGCDLHRLVFAPNDATTHGLAIHYVRQAVTRWEPRVKILRLDAYADRAVPSVLRVFLEYRLRSTGASGVIDFAFDLDGGGSEP